MNKYFDSAIMMTSLCSIGLATLSLAEDAIPAERSRVIKDMQLQKLDQSLTVNLKRLERDVVTTPRKTVIKKAVDKPSQKSTTPKVATAAISLVKEFEGFKDYAYVDTDGTPVIGYGLSRIAGKPVQLGDRISVGQANTALENQLEEIQQQLAKSIKVKLNDRQLSAVASLSFNAGVDSISASTLVRKLNAGDQAGAANEFLRWDKADVNGVLVQMPGLTRRREAERQLFLN